ncbi:polysaccharide deacetylase family protein [Paucibacter soli]|uniref:polysaccharide deacetylase family protein n=1 Tax=Paucibacter soli TaxID=3133433 RepID=UPI0030A31067
MSDAATTLHAHGLSRRAWLAAGFGADRSWAQPASQRVPVLCYHRVAATEADGMTLRSANFAAQLSSIEGLGCRLVPLADVVAYRLGRLASLPPRALALSIDDGHRSVHEAMAPLLLARRWPVTLFIYPSAISNARYALRWEQLRTLADTGLFSVQSHTYWHAHLLRERRLRTPADYQDFASVQLRRAKETLEARLGAVVSLLAWPFGLYDAGLCELARQAGYEAAFALGGRACTLDDPVFALPRYLMVDSITPKRLTGLLLHAFGEVPGR